jgi:hypothetical protein
MKTEVEVHYQGELVATLISDDRPQKIVKRSKKQMQGMGGDEEIRWDLDIGRKTVARSEDGRCYVAFFEGSQRGKIAIQDRGETQSYRLHWMRNIWFEDLEGLHQALGELLKKFEEVK